MRHDFFTGHVTWLDSIIKKHKDAVFCSLYSETLIGMIDICCRCVLPASVCRLVKNMQKMTPVPMTSLAAVKLNHKVVDFRKEKAIIRDLAYLTGNTRKLAWRFGG